MNLKCFNFIKITLITIYFHGKGVDGVGIMFIKVKEKRIKNYN